VVVVGTAVVVVAEPVVVVAPPATVVVLPPEMVVLDPEMVVLDPEMVVLVATELSHNKHSLAQSDLFMFSGNFDLQNPFPAHFLQVESFEFLQLAAAGLQNPQVSEQYFLKMLVYADSKQNPLRSSQFSAMSLQLLVLAALFFLLILRRRLVGILLLAGFLAFLLDFFATALFTSR